MAELDPVVLALEASLTRSESVEVRVALGEHLLSQGRSVEALAQLEAAVRLAPSLAHVEAAARAAEAAGEPRKAEMYRLAARAAPTAPSTVPAALPTTPGAAAERSPLRLVASDGHALEASAPGRSVSFDDIGGMQPVKERLTRSFLVPLQNPDLARRYGGQIGGGLVLYGPPGCGKTMFARALAHEIQATFSNIGLSDVLDMWHGESERKLHALFDDARRRRPSVVFIDEVDALGQRRTSLRGSAGRNLVNQLLAEMDGFDHDNDGLFFLGATNHPWDLDPALRRPGRFDRLLFVPPPDAEARRRILELALASRPTRGDLELSLLVPRTDGFSGADLAVLVRRAVEAAMEEAVRGGADVPIVAAHLRNALADVRPSTQAWFETARNYAVYSNESGSLDELLLYLKARRMA